MGTFNNMEPGIADQLQSIRLTCFGQTQGSESADLRTLRIQLLDEHVKH